MNDPWKKHDEKWAKVAVISKKRSRNLRIQIMGIPILLVTQLFGYAIGVDPVVMSFYPALVVVWGGIFLFNSLRYGRQIDSILKEE